MNSLLNRQDFDLLKSRQEITGCIGLKRKRRSNCPSGPSEKQWSWQMLLWIIPAWWPLLGPQASFPVGLYSLWYGTTKSVQNKCGPLDYQETGGKEKIKSLTQISLAQVFFIAHFLQNIFKRCPFSWFVGIRVEDHPVLPAGLILNLKQDLLLNLRYGNGTLNGSWKPALVPRRHSQDHFLSTRTYPSP